jgi:hypothetical protein
VRDALVSIAGDEARHAELAFKILAWALRTGGDEVRARIASDLAELRAAALPVASDPPGFTEHLGILSAATTRSVRARTLATLVIPCTEALLRTSA